MKMIYVLFMSLILSPSFTYGYMAKQVFKICLSGSTEKNIPQYGEAFENGVKLAIEENRLKNYSIQVESIFYENTPLGAVKAYKEAIKKNCHVIVGFSTGNDLIAIRDIASREPILVISIYGDPVYKKNKNENIFTMQPHPDQLLTYLIKNLNINLNKSKVLVVTAEDRAEMTQYRDSFEKIIKKHGGKASYKSVIEQLHDVDIISEDKEILSNQWDYVFLFTRSLIAAEIADKFKNQNKPVFIGTKYFGSKQLPAYHNFLSNKKILTYFARRSSAFNEEPKYLNFILKYKKRFSVDPMMISSDSYDIVSFLLKNIVDVKTIGPRQVLNFFKSVKDIHEGVGGILIGPKMSFNSKKYYVIKNTENGYELKR